MSHALFLIGENVTNLTNNADLPPLPEIGEPVTVGQLKQICIERGWYYHLAKIESKNPQGVFRSDGCSFWPDSWRGKDLYEACFKHDILYWMGGTQRERYSADELLMIDVMSVTNDFILAKAMFHGVRAGGIPGTSFPWRWGYGS